MVIKKLRWGWLLLTLGLLAYGLHVALAVVPTDADQGNIYRIFFYHLPTWIATSICFLTNLLASITYLAFSRSKNELALKADALAVSCAEMGVVFCMLGLITGSLWARPVWGIWWTWDARLTSTLVLWLIYVGYLFVRNFSSGAAMRTLAAVVAIFGYCDVPIVYMSTRWWRTQHPGPVIGGPEGTGIAPSMQPAVSWNVIAWLAWGALMVSLRYSVEVRRQRTEQAAALTAIEANLERSSL
jgi:heme exporter protein C